MGIFYGFLAAVLELIPLVGLADVSGDGELELVVGPQPGGTAGTVLRHADSKTVAIGRLVIVLGVE